MSDRSCGRAFVLTPVFSVAAAVAPQRGSAAAERSLAALPRRLHGMVPAKEPPAAGSRGGLVAGLAVSE